MIIDNVMTVEDQQKIKDTYPFFGWYYDTNTYRGDFDQIDSDDVYDVGQLSFAIYGKNVPEKSVFPLRAIFPIVRSIDHHLRDEETFKTLSIVRVKFNLLWRIRESLGKWNTPHIDVSNPEDMLSAIYYVKDADGDTCLFYPDETVRIKPKQGRVVVFPAHIQHASSNPVESADRVVINMVLKFDR